jgi:hypothetical protein
VPVNIQASVAAAFSFLEKEFGFTPKLDPASPDRHLEYSKDPLSVDIWWGKGEIDVTFVVSLSFSKNHAVFRPYVSRTFGLAQVALRVDPNALEPFRSRTDEAGGYITDRAGAEAFMTKCVEIMRRHCTPLLNGDLGVLEQLTIERRAHA